MLTMTTTPLKPGDLGIDYSYSRPGPKNIAKAGAKFVLRYTAGAASDPNNGSHHLNAGKLITPREFDALLHAGLDVIANDEWYETRVTEGRAAGEQDAKAAAALWKACGYAEGATIYASWDAAPAASQWAAVDAYRAGYEKVASDIGGYQLDMYAGTPYLRHFAAQHHTEGADAYGWRPNAGSWSNDGLPYQPATRTKAQRTKLLHQALTATPAAIWQTGNYWFGKTCDENMILRTPVGSHLEAVAAHQPLPKPKPKPRPASYPNVDHARAALQAASKQHPKNGPVGNAVRKALDDLKGI
jgi:hypothetical protein